MYQTGLKQELDSWEMKELTEDPCAITTYLVSIKQEETELRSCIWIIDTPVRGTSCTLTVKCSSSMV